MIKVLSIFGTRPEAIKMAPIVRELGNYPDSVTSKTCVTAQHRRMLDQVLELFEIVPDYDLNLMKTDQSPTLVVSQILSKLESILKKENPDWVLVQGDTTTALAASIASFYARVKVGHVEAGLRTHNKWHPFPEEINRRITGVVADRHFVPTENSRQNLLREEVPDDLILITGNTVIDALYWALDQPYDVKTLVIPKLDKLHKKTKIILITAHRRENFGEPIENICKAIREIANRFGDDVHFVYPVHLNPNIKQPVHKILGNVPNVSLLPPLDYLPFVHLMEQAFFVITDSGGIQEEAPSLGKPVLVLREVTERPEAVMAGTVKLIGTNINKIIAGVTQLITDSSYYEKIS